MTTQDLITKLSELSGDYQDLYDRVRDVSVRAQHEPFQRYALEQTNRAKAYLDTIVSDLRARESLAPLAESNKPARTAATEAFRRSREILKDIK